MVGSAVSNINGASIEMLIKIKRLIISGDGAKYFIRFAQFFCAVTEIIISPNHE